MKISLKIWQIAGLIFTSLAGTLLHFAYDWSNQSPLWATFSGVNESTWEHMKLLFFPMFVFALMQSRYLAKEYENFWCVKLVGTLVGLVLIPVLFYTYKGIVGISADWFNIAIFYLAALAGYLTEGFFMKKGIPCLSSTVALVVLCLIGVVFVLFTYLPPEIPLFQDPITGGYGI